MPFGLHNSVATFQRLIDRVVIGVDLEEYVFGYLDDIVVVSRDFKTHLEALREVFRRLKAAGPTVNKEKCHFCRPELKFLGYIVTNKGLRVDPEKVEAIVNYPVPKTVKEVRRFLGVAGWYRRFVPSFATVAAPLTNLMKKNKQFQWSSGCAEAFATLKECLISGPVLRCPDFSLPFSIQCDASDFGIAIILSQTHEDGEYVITRERIL